MKIPQFYIRHLITVLVLLFLVLYVIPALIYTLPQCAEDVVLVGVGDFENGRWSSYVCGPAVDDYVTQGE